MRAVMEEIQVHYQGSRLLFMEEIQEELAARNISAKTVMNTCATRKRAYSEPKNDADLLKPAGKELQLAGDAILGEVMWRILDKADEPYILVLDVDRVFTGKNRESLLAIIEVKRHPEIEGYFSEKEGMFYHSMVKDIKGGKIAEIGSWKGNSASFIGRTANRNDTELNCVDWWTGSLDWEQERRRKIEKQDIESEFRNNMEERGIKVNVLKGTSVDGAKHFEDGTLDLVFIDASHDFDSVWGDISAWYPKLKPGGTLSGHNYDSHEDVKKAADKFAAENGMEIKKGPGSIWYAKK
jgi:predicted O-methyltransferase YrrM